MIGYIATGIRAIGTDAIVIASDFFTPILFGAGVTISAYILITINGSTEIREVLLKLLMMKHIQRLRKFILIFKCL